MSLDAYYADDSVTIYHGDALTIVPRLDGVDAVVADPPYNIGKADWDRIPDYLSWSHQWIKAASSALRPAGAFWVFHSDPLVLADLARLVAQSGRPLVSMVTLDKSHWGIARRYANGGTKTFPASVEYASYHRREVYAEEIAAIRQKHGLTRAQFDTLIAPSRKPTGLCYRWEHGERIPQQHEVEAVREQFGTSLTLPTFHNPDKHSAVWACPPPRPNPHPTPKPVPVVARMIECTTNVGDLVLDPFGGSGTTAIAARMLGRRAVLVEADERYCEIAARRLAQDVLQPQGGPR